MAPMLDGVPLEVVLLCLAMKGTPPIYLVDFRMEWRRRGEKLASEDAHHSCCLPSVETGGTGLTERESGKQSL